VEDNGLVAALGKFQGGDQHGQIVAVNGTQVAQAHFFKDQAASKSAASVGVPLVRGFFQHQVGHGAFQHFLGFVAQPQGQVPFRDALEQAVKVFLKPIVGRMSDQFVQVLGDGTHVFGDRPFVVVEDADEFLGGMGDVVQRLKRNAIRQCGITEYGHHVFIRATSVPGNRNPERRRQGGTRMRGTIAVMLALRAQGKPVQAIGGADGVEPFFAPGKELVHVGLVTDVPYKFVMRGAETPMQRDGEFHHAKVGAEMASVFRQAVNQFLPDIIRQALQLIQSQLLDVLRAVYHVQVSIHIRL